MAADPSVQFTHGIGGAGQFQRQYRHAERFALVLRVDAAQLQDLREGHRKLPAEPVHGVIHQIRTETVVAGLDRCMGGKDALGVSLVQRILEVFTLGHFLAQ